MQYISQYRSQLGEILLAADEIGLTGLWFYGQKYFPLAMNREHEERDCPVFVETRRWLDLYFSGTEPDFSVPVHLIGTDFQREVWGNLCNVPYGHTITYAEIARQLCAKRGIKSMSAQAVGGAVSHNPISVIVPCHRVIMQNGALGGYAGGAEKKAALLRLEKKSAIQKSGQPLQQI